MPHDEFVLVVVVFAERREFAEEMFADIKNLLFVELLGGVGDVLIALPAIEALGRSYPDARLTVLTFAPGGELLRRHPHIHRVVCAVPKSPWQSVANLLKEEPFDLVVSDTNYGGIDHLIRRSGVRHTVTNLWREPPEEERVGERFCRLLLEERVIAPHTVGSGTIHLSEEERRVARRRLEKTEAPPLVFLIPEAGMAIKEWPLQHFVALGRALLKRASVRLWVGTGRDPGVTNRLADAIGGATRPWPRGGLRELAAALGVADLVIGADTGPMRIAAAVGTPTLTLFGPSWAGRYGQPPPHRSLQGEPGCPDRVIADFTRQRCWYSGRCTQGLRSCLQTLTPGAVLADALSLLGAKGGPAGR